MDKIAQMNGAFLDKMTRLACRLFFDCMTIKIEKRRKRSIKMNPNDKLMDKYHFSLHESRLLLVKIPYFRDEFAMGESRSAHYKENISPN